MSWLNLNDSLNNLKGQITSFASGVLADGIVNDTDPFTELSQANQKIQELQNLCASQDVEITNLRRQNADFYEKLSTIASSANASDSHNSGVANNGENWFWDPPASDVTAAPGQSAAAECPTVAELTRTIATLQQEKCELVQNLEQLDLDCQRTTDKLVTLKDDIQADFNNLKVECEGLQMKIDAGVEEKRVLENDLESRDLELKKLSDLCKDLEEQIELLHKGKESVIVAISNHKVDENVHNELKIKYDTLSNENEGLRMQIENIQSDTVSLVKHKELIAEFENLQIKFNDLELKNNTAQEKIYQLNSDFEEMKLNDTSIVPINLSDDHKKLQDMFDELKHKYEVIAQERKDMHRKYVGILTENVKKYVDHQIPDDFVSKPNENPFLSEFSSKVETTLKLLLDFKWKTETLERKLCEITHEKSVAITEKNREIEKLLHNSEILSQEVITKTQTIKDYEMECSELIKNNDLLISDLQQYKNNNGLQTISESNEDNLLLMETQLDNANKRIRELELAIGDMENAKQDVALETQTELDYIKKQLNMTGRELSQSKKEYNELLNNFKQLETEHANKSSDFAKIQSEYEVCIQEKLGYETNLEKVRCDMENVDYKYTEANVNLEAICEELRNTKKELAEVSTAKAQLEAIGKDLEVRFGSVGNELDEINARLQSEMELRSNLEIQHKEKLQNSKMSETVLKLQNDQAKKELDVLSETKVKLESQLQLIEREFLDLKTGLKTILSSFGYEMANADILECLESLKQQLTTLKTRAEEGNNKRVEDSEERNIRELVQQNFELQSARDVLQNRTREYENRIIELERQLMEVTNKMEEALKEREEIETKYNEKREMCSKLDTQNFELSSKITQLETELNNLHSSKNELVNHITVKHQDNIQYYTEIQRLNHIITVESEKYVNLERQYQALDKTELLASKDSDIEKLSDQNNFLKEKCEKLAQNLLDEQSNTQKIISDRQTILDREQSLTKELERLRLHLVEIEDSYTQELLLAEQRNGDMRAKLNEIEQRERDSSTIYTSVSIRANQQVETLQNQLQLVTVQRDELQRKISEAEDKNNKQVAALTNLQCVLEQFQRDKEKDIVNETERIRRQITCEREKQSRLQSEIDTLRTQLEESKQGLQAAARLTEQMERSRQHVVTMKDEVSKLQDQLSKTQEKYNQVLNQTDAKVDKTLIKNLVVGFISSNSNLNTDQVQILKIISTVLDFSSQDNEKLNLKKQGSWLNAILHPQMLSGNEDMTQQSLSEAFVRFLETESQPKAAPTLVDVTRTTADVTQNGGAVKQAPLLLNEVLLPTFADFAQSRSSSSILKNVLKDN